MTDKKTLVIGASENPDRYSNRAIRNLRAHHHSVVAIGSKPGKVEDVVFGKETLAFENVDTVTLYLNPTRQKEYYDYILSLKPKRIIFNPGTENSELVKLAQDADIDTIYACTLVMLNTEQY